MSQYIKLDSLICCNDHMVYIKEYKEAICVWCDTIKENIQDINEYYDSPEYDMGWLF